MFFTDTHIHLADIAQSPEAVLSRFDKNGIVQCVCVSAKPSDWPKVAALAEKFFPKVIPAFGLHPWYLSEGGSDWSQGLEDYLKAFPQALVGECGLDRAKSKEMALQTAVFETQIRLAVRYRRTLSVHAVRAVEALENLLPIFPEKFILHGFNGRAEHLNAVLKHGGYISFNSSVLRNKTRDKILTTIPKDRILLESDAPNASQPEEIPELCREIAQIRHEKPDDLAQQIYLNTSEALKQ